jgi:Protein of unknown function (DUF2500)
VAWVDNSRKPMLTEHAMVVAKRSNTSGNLQHDAGGSVSTRYYATFEFSLGDRLEFVVGGREYGLLSEGDQGELTYQGTWYHGFERDRT